MMKRQDFAAVKKTPNHFLSFVLLMTVGTVLLIGVSAAFMLFGAEPTGIQDVIRGLFCYDPDSFVHIVVRDIRLPRLLADIIVGVSLAVAGAVMQGNTKNPMADSGLMGISSGSVFAILLMMLFVPHATRLERIGYSFMGAAGATLLIYAIAMLGRRNITSDRMVLAGMAISTLFGSVTTAIMLKDGLSAGMMKYSAGSSANTLWSDVAVAAPFFIVGFLVSILISRMLTVLNLGEDVSRGLGANVKIIKFLSTMVVLVLSATAVIIIGPVGYVGLMVPHIVRYFVGTDYRLILPSCAVIGALFVVLVDLLARVLIAPLEFPIGVLVTMIGVPFFIFISRRQKNDTFAG